MKSKNSLNATRSPAEQQALDLQLIRAVKNPRGEAQNEDELTQTVVELLTLGADIEARVESDDGDDGDYTTVLIFAAENGHIEIVAKLLEKGANANTPTSDGVTALMVAAGYGHIEIVSTLLSCDEIKVNAVRSDGIANGITALMIAAEYGHAEIVAQLLARGANVNAVRSDDVTALMIAAAKGHAETVLALLSRDGIDVNATSSDGYTALMAAAGNGHAETVLTLLSRDGVDWQIVQNQFRHPALQDLNEEVSLLLAVIIPDKELPDKELRNSIIESFNQRNPNSPINQENNDILGAGPEMYKTLKDLKSLYKRYLIDPIDPDSGLGLSEHEAGSIKLSAGSKSFGLGLSEHEAEILANQRFFDLLNHQDMRKEALARNDLITALVGESAFLAINSGFGDEEALGPVRELNPEDFYTLTTKIIDSGKNESGIPKLKDSLVVAALRKDREDQASASPATTISNSSIKPVTKENGAASLS